MDKRMTSMFSTPWCTKCSLRMMFHGTSCRMPSSKNCCGIKSDSSFRAAMEETGDTTIHTAVFSLSIYHQMSSNELLRVTPSLRGLCVEFAMKCKLHFGLTTNWCPHRREYSLSHLIAFSTREGNESSNQATSRNSYWPLWLMDSSCCFRLKLSGKNRNVNQIPDTIGMVAMLKC